MNFGTSYYQSRITSDNYPLSLLKINTEDRKECRPSFALRCTEALHSSAQHSKLENIYTNAAQSDNTRRAYLSDIKHFTNWGGMIPATPQIVTTYLIQHAEKLSPYTLKRRLVAIKLFHQINHFENPCDDVLVTSTLRGIQRLHGKPQRQVEPLLHQDLFKIINNIPNTVKGVRDKALLLVGFSGALRRSELVAIRVDDLEFVTSGVVIQLRKSKTDQIGSGRKIAIPYSRSDICPVKCLQAWLQLSLIETGLIFKRIIKSGKITDHSLTPQSVALLVKGYVEREDLNPMTVSGHSLRAGFITSAAQAGVDSWKIRQQSGHKSDAMLARYIRNADLFMGNAAGAIF